MPQKQILDRGRVDRALEEPLGLAIVAAVSSRTGGGGRGVVGGALLFQRLVPAT